MSYIPDESLLLLTLFLLLFFIIYINCLQPLVALRAEILLIICVNIEYFFIDSFVTDTQMKLILQI